MALDSPLQIQVSLGKKERLCHSFAPAWQTAGGARTRNSRQQQGRRQKIEALQIDRRKHFDLAWQRQKVEEAVLEQEAQGLPRGVVTEVRNMPHLDRILEASGPSVVTMCFYSRSCGSCKDLLHSYARLCHEVRT
ncbi:hypothetical protein WJX84_005552 [Apatococcus fuscideae]|uniref:Thioredoxin domain-containing protein n=1 Tax=Apatococcus fuscideae TaxID=2026836 RepID=A0AAW1SXY5_9CHLO